LPLDGNKVADIARQMAAMLQIFAARWQKCYRYLPPQGSKVEDLGRQAATRSHILAAK
jgi:hypothetical protein